MATRKRRDKWAVYGEYGGNFTNLREACDCAKEYSKICPGEVINVWLIDDELNYFDYLNGKCIRDGWTIRNAPKRSEYPPCIRFGINTDPYDGQKWLDLVAQFKEAVEREGHARASWSCEGRTRHHMHSCQLQEALKDEGYEWDINYDYRCVARKVV